MKVLVLGADGFIGRHIAFHLRDLGHEVIAQARSPGRLAAMGFRTMAVDLTDPRAAGPAFWAPHAAGAAVVIAAGLLTGTAAAFRAVHVDAARAVIAATDGPVVLISAAGIDGADTPFARWRRAAEEMAHGRAVILRPGLVLGDTSYGGSSLLRALAALPLAVPVVGDGVQAFNPIHAADLAAVVAQALDLPPGRWDIGGPEVVTQGALAMRMRGWLGLRPVPLLPLPLWLARGLGHAGDALRLGPVSATAVAQLQAGVMADPARFPPLAAAPRGFGAFLNARPAGTQDLWQARLYLLKPLVRLVLAAMWLWSAALGLFLPLAAFAAQVAVLPGPMALALARAGGIADLLIGLLLLRNIAPRRVALAQLAVVGGYTAGLTLLAPGLWLDPFGGLLKNLPVLALVLIHLALAEER